MTPEAQAKLITAISAGNYYEASAAFAGVSYTTFYHWMTKGKDAVSGKYKEFYDRVKQAEAQAEVRIVAQWQAQIPENWAAARDFLARRHPERWANREKAEIGLHGKDDKPIPIRFELGGLPLDVLRGLAEEPDECEEGEECLEGTGED